MFTACPFITELIAVCLHVRYIESARISLQTERSRQLCQSCPNRSGQNAPPARTVYAKMLSRK